MTDYATLEREIESLDEATQNAVQRPLGGYEAGFYMAPDFDAPLDDFAEYA